MCLRALFVVTISTIFNILFFPSSKITPNLNTINWSWEWTYTLMSQECYRLKSPSRNQMIIVCRIAHCCLSQRISWEQFYQLSFETMFHTKIWGVDWLYATFSIDEHPSNAPFKLAVWCKSMQVNILRDFTKITIHVLQGQLTLKILSFPWLCERQILSSIPCNLVMEIYSSFRLTWSIVQVISVFWSNSH